MACVVWPEEAGSVSTRDGLPEPLAATGSKDTKQLTGWLVTNL